MKKHKCRHEFIDGGWVHINAEYPLSPEVQEAIEKMVKIAKNYVSMKSLTKEDNSDNTTKLESE